MPLLSIDGQAYEAWVGSPNYRREQGARTVRELADGRLHVCVTGVSTVRVWPVQVGGDPAVAGADGFLALADAIALFNALADNAAHELAGDLIGETVDVLPEDVTLLPTGADAIAVVSFNAVEVAA